MHSLRPHTGDGIIARCNEGAVAESERRGKEVGGQGNGSRFRMEGTEAVTDIQLTKPETMRA